MRAPTFIAKQLLMLFQNINQCVSRQSATDMSLTIHVHNCDLNPADMTFDNRLHGVNRSAASLSRNTAKSYIRSYMLGALDAQRRCCVAGLTFW